MRRRNFSIVSGKREKLRGGKKLVRPSQSGKEREKAYGVLLVSTLSTHARLRLHILHVGQKMYSKQTVYDAHLTSKKHVKAAAKQVESGAPPLNPNGPSTSQTATNGHANGSGPSAKSKHRTAALLTHLTTKLLVLLTPVLNDTKSNVERRFSLTAREREQELLEQSKPKPPPAPTTGTGEGGEEEEEEERIYNPLKLPLGWDGKPIPYWLYKLHGLGVEYRCEICSDHVYMGRYGPCYHK